ncbi:hypothetical protein [Amycolatopsis decaplanina]|uniref:hypothetical protein n=1 Tax=Amycolatopsis decaplanina TaxID=208441 RepID=UPI0003449C77|nr:hypothetical protein [Amycolatopsis decaplanina]
MSSSAVAGLGEVKSMVLDHVGKFEVTSEDPLIFGAVAHIDDKARPASGRHFHTPASF